MNICFLEVFQKNRDNRYPETNPNELQEYIKKGIWSAIQKLNSIGNTINVRKVYLDIDPKIDPNFGEISIDFDTSGPSYETTYLRVPITIISPPVPMPSKNLMDQFYLRDKYANGHNFSYRTLCHEFGHLQDAQRKEFGYKKPNKELLPYVEIIWNVLLEARLSKHCMAAREKEDNRKAFYRKLKELRAKTNPKDFECLWQKQSYNYKEIRKLAQKYFDSCEANRS